MKSCRGSNSRRKSGKGHSSQAKKHPRLEDFTMQDLLKGKQLELVAAALLLTGRLKVDAVALFRNSPVISVTLLGQFRTKEKGRAEALDNLLAQYEDISLFEIIEAMQRRIGGG